MGFDTPRCACPDEHVLDPNNPVHVSPCAYAEPRTETAFSSPTSTVDRLVCKGCGYWAPTEVSDAEVPVGVSPSTIEWYCNQCEARTKGTFACPVCREREPLMARFVPGPVTIDPAYMSSPHRHDACCEPVEIPFMGPSYGCWNDDGRWFRFCGVIARDGMGRCDLHRELRGPTATAEAAVGALQCIHGRPFNDPCSDCEARMGRPETAEEQQCRLCKDGVAHRTTRWECALCKGTYPYPCRESAPQEAVERAAEIVRRLDNVDGIRTEQVERVGGGWVVVVSYLRGESSTASDPGEVEALRANVNRQLMYLGAQEEEIRGLKAVLEKIASTPGVPKAAWNLAADALCWARKHEPTPCAGEGVAALVEGLPRREMTEHERKVFDEARSAQYVERTDSSSPLPDFTEAIQDVQEALDYWNDLDDRTRSLLCRVRFTLTAARRLAKDASR